MRTRLVAVDAARGVALLSMLAVFTFPHADAAGQLTWSYAILGGRAAAAFAVLAGVSTALMTARWRASGSGGRSVAAGLAARALVIGLLGLALSHTDPAPGAVILPYYGLLFLMAIPLVFMPTWLVAAAGVGFAAGAPALTHVLLPHLPDPGTGNPGFWDALSHPVALLIRLSITGAYPALPWMVYMCAGVVVGRMSLARLRVAAGLLATGVALAVAASVASWTLLTRYGGLTQIWATQPRSSMYVPETLALLNVGGDGTVPSSTWWWQAVGTPHTSTPVDLLGTTGTAIGLLGAVLLAGHLARPALRRSVAAVRAPLAAAGSMTLTLYVAHLVFVNSSSDIHNLSGFLVEAAVVLLLALAWRATAGRGPLEGLVAAASSRTARWAAGPFRRSRPRPGFQEPITTEEAV